MPGAGGTAEDVSSGFGMLHRFWEDDIKKRNFKMKSKIEENRIKEHPC